MAGIFKSVMQTMDLDKYLDNIKGRKIVIEGTDDNGQMLMKLIEDKGFEVYSFIDYNSQKQVDKFINKDVLSAEVLAGNSKDFYIFITGNYEEEKEKYLNENGYCELEDYLYILHKPTIVQNEEEYTDIYGNKIKAPVGTEFKFLGYNSNVNIDTCIKDKVKISCSGSIVNIGSDCNMAKNISIDCFGKSEVIIGDECLIGDSVTISATINSIINLDPKCKIRNNSLVQSIEESSIKFEKSSFNENTVFFAKKKSSISIGRGSFSGPRLVCTTYFGGNIKIGADCMFSEYVTLMNNDGHPIFDIKTGKQINGSKDIIIGNHVWLGIKTTILSGTDIGNASIVGANSLVNKKFSNNCIIAGNPAKMIRKDIAWDTEETNSELIDKSLYWDFTN